MTETLAPTAAAFAFLNKFNGWRTPAKYIEAARSVMGRITLDPASSSTANRTVRADRFFTPDDDGLSLKWGDVDNASNVWLNPPYGNLGAWDDKREEWNPKKGPSNQNLWTEKLLEEYDAKRVDQAVLLITNSTEATRCQTLLRRGFLVCFVEGRIGFVGEDGILEVKQNTKGSAIFYLPPRYGDPYWNNRFRAVFSEFGQVR